MLTYPLMTPTLYFRVFTLPNFFVRSLVRFFDFPELRRDFLVAITFLRDGSDRSFSQYQAAMILARARKPVKDSHLSHSGFGQEFAARSCQGRGRWPGLLREVLPSFLHSRMNCQSGMFSPRRIKTSRLGKD
jgi:hypothetical protein